MNKVTRSLRSVLGIALTWAIVWTALWTIVGVIIGIVNPDSIDPGEGMMFVAVFGPMGFLSGIAFGLFLHRRGSFTTSIDLSASRAAGWGIVATAIVQLAYLGHGDAGLAANIKLAMLFSLVGGVVTLIWLAVVRAWLHWRPSQSAPERPRAI